MAAPILATRGLGLDICRRVLAELGGSLRFDASSETTCFVVSLPAVVDPAKQERDERRA